MQDESIQEIYVFILKLDFHKLATPELLQFEEHQNDLVPHHHGGGDAEKDE